VSFVHLVELGVLEELVEGLARDPPSAHAEHVLDDVERLAVPTRASVDADEVGAVFAVMRGGVVVCDLNHLSTHRTTVTT